jgi:MFS family permease
MTYLLDHFSLHAAKWNGLVIGALLLVWAAVLGCVVSSILTQPFDRRQRVFWITLVILLPFVGVLCYLPFAFRKEELPHMFQRKSRRAHKAAADSSIDLDT